MSKKYRWKPAVWIAVGLLALLSVGVASTLASATPVHDVRGRVVLMEDGDPKKSHENVVVYLKGVPDALPDTSKMSTVVRQREKQFTPPVSVALLNSTIHFPNDDNIFHNVFSLSKASRFDLGLYKSGDSKSIKARKVGVIDVYCNIHPQMAAKVVVLDTKYHAITEADGKFRIPGVPPGTYELVAWQPRGKEITRKVTVGPRSAELRLELVETQGRKQHTRKDGTPYGRYE